jgi:hypothetical protein
VLPASGQQNEGGSGGGSQAWRRWGPIAAIVAIVAAGAGVLVATSSGGDDDGNASGTTTPSVATTGGEGGASTTPAPATSPTSDTPGDGTTAPGSGPSPTTASGEITYPLSFPEAEEQAIEVEWGDRCNTETGRLAIPDPYAQACFAPFEGDNGGATDEGVTAESIKIVLYQEQEADPIMRYITDAVASDDTNAQRFQTIENMVGYYEAFHETYGRNVELVRFEASGTAIDEVAARADAVRIAEDIKPFMVWGGPILTPAFGDELAARGVLCMSCAASQPPSFYVEGDPFLWTVDGGPGQRQDHSFEFVSKQLIGRPAAHAGDELTDTERKFGLLYIDTGSGQTALADLFASRMEDAGAPFAEVVQYALDPATIQQTALQAITRMKTAGVTTIVFAGDPVAPRDFSREATAQDYFPEWVLAGASLADTTAFARTYDQQQWQHAMGVTVIPARTLPSVSGAPFLHEWFYGEPAPAETRLATDVLPAAVFFPVLQGAGPNLTRENWAEALAAGTPTATGGISVASLDWGDDAPWEEFDHHGVDDATLIWWDPEATGPDELRRDGQGMWQYVNGGARYLPGEWPTEDELFDRSNSVAIYEERPPAEEVPDYPSPAG